MAKANLNYEVPAHLKREFVFQTAGVLPPNGLLFGFNTVQKAGAQANALGGKQVLLVTDEVMVQLGYAELVKELLEKEGMKVDVYGKVDPEPHIETAADALYEMARKAKSDLIVGLAGGSSMDMAKLTAIAVPNEIAPLDLMSKKKEAVKPSLKKVLIPRPRGREAKSPRCSWPRRASIPNPRGGVDVNGMEVQGTVFGGVSVDVYEAPRLPTVLNVAGNTKQSLRSFFLVSAGTIPAPTMLNIHRLPTLAAFVTTSLTPMLNGARRGFLFPNLI